MSRRRDTVRLPLEPLRRRVAEATGRSAPFVDLTDVELAENTLEVTFETPEEDVPIATVVVEGPDGRTDATPIRLDTPSGLRVHGELLRIEYAGRDAETDDILVSVDRRDGESWRTLLGCGQMWAVDTGQPEAPNVTCRVETPDRTEEDAEADDSATEQPEESDDGDPADGGFLSSLG
ncbi:hypothetical protein [Halobellus sp. GM3]|uniref:hypothetical protein n=1 Tax=Halobellus sp. GM3 TaxID=3458410 RepID=UPI00403DE167